MNQIQDIKDQIILNLKEIEELYDVTGYVESSTGFPYGICKYKGSFSDYKETHGIIATHSFQISIILNYDLETETEDNVILLSNLLLDKLYSDITLKGLVNKIQVGNITPMINEEDGKTKEIVVLVDTILYNNF